MAARGKNKARNQRGIGSSPNAPWFNNRKDRSKKSRKEQKRSRRQNR